MEEGGSRKEERGGRKMEDDMGRRCKEKAVSRPRMTEKRHKMSQSALKMVQENVQRG